jgi:hypothetical protein
MPEQAKLAEAQAEQLEQAIQAATGGKAATILFSRTWIEMVNELKEKADIRGPILQYNHYLKPEIFNENGGPLKLSEMLFSGSLCVVLNELTAWKRRAGSGWLSGAGEDP